MDLEIKGKRAAIAAASAGLGFGCAKALASEGVRVAICGRDQDRIEAAARDIGSGTVAICTDLADPRHASSFIEQAADQLGGNLDIVIANAGGPPPGQPSSTTLEEYQVALDLNLKSTIALCQAAIPGMTETGWGRLLAITSSGAKQPIPFLAASSVARAGVTSFIKTLATEVAASGITANTIQPGLHLTDRVRQLGDPDAMAQSIPAKALGDPLDFGRAAAFLCSEPAKFITGTSLLLDGGGFPGLL